MYWFAKELPDQPFYLSSGKKFTFSTLATEDAWMIGELRSAIRNGIGGVREVTQLEYEEIKKKEREKPSPDSFPRRAELNPFNHLPPHPASHAGVNSRREMPDPIVPVEPKKFVRLTPKVAKVDG